MTSSALDSPEPPRSRAATLRQLGELTLTHVATFAFPLVFAVVCGRTLGIHDYGIVSFYAALGGFLGMFIEFGMDWHGVREVGRLRDRPAECHAMLWRVTATRLVLCAASLALVGLALWQVRAHAEWPLMVAAAGYLAGFAMDAGWYVRAIEQTRLLLAITTGVRLIGIAVLLVAVPRLATMESALAVYALVSMLTSAVTWFHLLRRGHVRRAPVAWRDIGAMLRTCWAIVLGNVNGAMLTHGGLALLGLHAEPSVVGAASLALRVRMAGQAVLLPVQQLGFVRISALAGRGGSPRAVLGLGRRLLAVTLAAAVAVAGAAMLAAPEIVRHVFRGEEPVAVTLVMMLALSVPLQGVANLFGLQTLIALRQERAYALIQSLATGAFCAVLLGFAAHHQAYGWAILGAEATAMALAAGRLIGLMRAPAAIPAEATP